MRIVLDTNLWVSGLTRPPTPSGLILQEVRRGRFDPVASVSLVEEMIDVLCRPKIRTTFDITDVELQEALSLLLRPLVPDVPLDAPVPDPKDKPVVASAIAGCAEMIVSGNTRHLHESRLVSWLAERGVRVRTPRQLLVELEETAPDPWL